MPQSFVTAYCWWRVWGDKPEVTSLPDLMQTFKHRKFLEPPTTRHFGKWGSRYFRFPYEGTWKGE